MGHNVVFHDGYPRMDMMIIPLARRLSVVPHLLFGCLVGIGAFADRPSFDNEVYRPLFRFVSLTGWGITFWIVAALAVVVLCTGSYRFFVATNLLMTFISTSWLLVLLNAQFVDEAIISATEHAAIPLRIGLWTFVVSTCLINAAIPVRVLEVGKSNA